MPRPVLVVAVSAVLLLAGCGERTPPPAEPAPPGVVAEFMADQRDDAESPYDIWSVSFLNLNGSVVMEFVVNGTGPGKPYPFYNVSIEVQRADGGRLDLWAAVVFDPSRAAPGARAIAGVQKDSSETTWNVCHAFAFGSPSKALHELVHARTGLLDGATIVAVSAEVMDHNGTVYDTAEASGSFAVLPGPNPYVPEGGDPDDNCPLLRDPSSPQFRG